MKRNLEAMLIVPILVLMLIVPMLCQAQVNPRYKTELIAPTCDTLVIPRYDTVYCAMLVCDTSKVALGEYEAQGEHVSVLYVDSGIYWCYGYVVIWHYLNDALTRFDEVPGAFLDKKKRPLAKNLLVFNYIKL